jgi:choline-sulfatase
VKGGARCEAPVYLQDVMATALDLAGADRKDVDFKSLLPLVRGEAKDLHGDIYGAYLDLQRMITREGWKLLHYPKARVYRLFNLVEDPLEMNDLAGDPGQASRLDEMKAALQRLQERMDDPLVKSR